MGPIETPADVRLTDPVGDVLQVVVAEREARAHGLRAGEVEHLASGDAAAGQVEQLGGDRQQRVGLDQGPVGQLDTEPVRGMRVAHDLPEAEVRRDQRGVSLDVGAHDEDVAGLQCLVVGEQAEQHLAQHVDLPGRAVTGVHLHRAVTGLQRTALRPNLIGGDVGLQPAQQGVRAVIRHQELVVGDGGQRALQFAEIAAQGGEQRVIDAAVAVVVATGHRGAKAVQRGPQRGTRVRQPQVHVVVFGQCIQQFDVGDREPGVAEQRDPPGQIGPRFTKPRQGRGVPHVRGVDPHDLDQPAPQLRLPGQVVVQTGFGVAAIIEPADQQRRALPGVGGEQPGQPAAHPVAAALAQFPLDVIGLEETQVRGQRAAPRLPEAGVDDLQQRPGHGLRRPRVLVAGAGDLTDQGGRRTEDDTRAHPVGARAGAEAVREPLGQPALHPAGGHDHKVFGERVRGRAGQQFPQPVREDVGAFRAVDVQAHCRPT